MNIISKIYSNSSTYFMTLSCSDIEVNLNFTYHSDLTNRNAPKLLKFRGVSRYKSN